jgi:hypothetical protein
VNGVAGLGSIDLDRMPNIPDRIDELGVTALP